MGGITSGVGIFSGINTAQLIDQLIAIESRPKQLAQQRVVTLQTQRAAFLDINTSILAFKTAATKFNTAKIFRTARATSSKPDAVVATAGTSATPGSYNFTVKRLVSTQQQISRGFTDSTISGIGATEFTFELGGGSLTSETKLADLNGGSGVRRGKIEIKDATGATAIIDLSTAATVNDVLDAINSSSSISVTAQVDGDRISITDTSGVSGTLAITDTFGSFTAADLGLAQTTSAGIGQSINGADVRTLSGGSALALLNDGAGVNIRDGGDDLIITDREGNVHNIDLGQISSTTGDPPVTTITQSRATTLSQVITYINDQTGGKVTAALNASKTGLVLTDTTGASASNLIVQSGANGRTTAADLGIETAPAGVASSTVDGKRLISGINSTLVRSLRGGDGIPSGSITIADRDGNIASLTISAGALAGSVADVIDDLNSQLQTAGVGVTVAFNRAGNGLALTDTSGGSGDIVASGAAATLLGITTGSGAGGEFNGSNLQTRWISRATLLSSLNAGKGIGTGQIRVTDASGASRTISIASSLKNVDDLVQYLNNNQGLGITADINDNGDGIVIRDTSGGEGTLKIEDVTGSVAKSLNLVGEDDDDEGSTEINGSFERKVTFSATDTLETIANKINSAGVNVGASVINDGSSSSGARLSLSSKVSGSVGRVVVDTGALDLGLSTLSKGQNSLVFFGSSDPAQAVLLSSSSNTLDNVVQGVTIDIKAVSADPVEIVVTRDTDSMEKTIAEFVDAYNNVLTRLSRYDTYDQDTNKAGALFGDGTLSVVRQSLLTGVQSKAEGVDTQFQYLFEVGVKVGKGAKLEFDREKFRTAYQTDAVAVENLFAARSLEPKEEQTEISPGVFVRNTSTRDTFSQLGVAEKLGVLANDLTSSVDGMITRKGRTLDDQIKLQQNRITAFDVRLDSRRQVLLRQFTAMEQAIASLQTQSSALSSISSIR